MSTRTATRATGTAVGGLRRSAKRVLRGVGIATSWARPLPDFVVIGAKRAGTTSLYAYLAEHPDVASLFPALQRIKGVHYFDSNHHRGVRWYRSHMPSWIRRTGGRLAGEASPYYLAHPLAAERAARTIPGAKLVVLLRNPADRAYSHYRERVRHDAEPLTFEEAIEREPERLAGEVDRIRRDPRYSSSEHEDHGYLTQGMYAELLEPWLRGFPPESFHFERSEDLYADPRGAYARLLRFLGLQPFEPKSFEAFNYHPGSSMRPETRERLLEYFAPHNRRLSELLGLDLGSWDA